VILSEVGCAHSRGSLPRDPLSQLAKPLRKASAHPPLHTPRRKHLGELYEQAGDEQPLACSGVIRECEHSALMQESFQSVKRSSVTYSGRLAVLVPELCRPADFPITEVGDAHERSLCTPEMYSVVWYCPYGIQC
jgi:hypothetical protein